MEYVGDTGKRAQYDAPCTKVINIPKPGIQNGCNYRKFMDCFHPHDTRYA